MKHAGNDKHIKILAALGRAADSYGLKAWAVGGFVRDRYLGKRTFDIDVCVEGPLKELVDFCSGKYESKAVYFKNFGTSRVNFKNGLKIDFVTCRREVYTGPAALPQVRPSNLTDDLYRRDFTANAWALSIMPYDFLKSFDLFQSQFAIDNKIIKILHNKSFVDDPTRIFRALRFAARFKWRLEAGTEKLLKQAVKNKVINLLSRERIRQELFKILEEKNPLPCFALLDKYGVTKFIYPSLKCPKTVLKLKDAKERLALLLLSLGKNAEDFLKFLRLERAVFNDMLAIINFCNNKEALLKPLHLWQQKIIRLHMPRISKYAFKPLVISGGDLKKAGLEGKAINICFKNIAKAQFAGKIKSSKEAFAYLRCTNTDLKS
jgi:tRNA nucleotidyltransferase/poly(A) polymerase